MEQPPYQDRWSQSPTRTDLPRGIDRPDGANGGAVISDAVTDRDNVVGLVYVAGFAPDEGERLAEVESTSKDSVLNSALVSHRSDHVSSSGLVTGRNDGPRRQLLPSRLPRGVRERRLSHGPLRRCHQCRLLLREVPSKGVMKIGRVDDEFDGGVTVRSRRVLHEAIAEVG